MLGSGKLYPVDYLFLSGQRQRLHAACLVQLSRQSQINISINRDKLFASRGKKGILGKKTLASAIKTQIKNEHELTEINFFERAVAAQGAKDKWFAGKEKAMISNYERRGFMRDGVPASRGVELVRLYTEETESLVEKLRSAFLEEKIDLVDKHAEWLFIRYTSRQHYPEAFNKEREEFAIVAEPIINDPGITSKLSDSTLYILSLLEKEFAKKRALKPPKESGNTQDE